ncbi:DMT family transporter [Natronoflexus pectinivorans]|uniref:Putative membrane protein n=1 Tax=Natronoflexus pectinivorans TaxID=682526 RepID=A0A4R2GLA3_9BACT|nr:DMT family transporter [Natronoflexus pectinivorans]TCO09357.1 putative membrane protein [Natronoflexus pectinivorans]
MNEFVSGNLGELSALLTAFCWTFTSLAFESAGKKVGSLPVNLIRLVMALFWLGFYTLITNGHFFPQNASTHAWVWLSVSGLIGFVIGDLLLFQAFVVTGARISMLLMSLSPPLTALFGWLIIGEKLSIANSIGMFVTIWGIALVILAKPVKGRKMQFHYPAKGILLALGGAAGQGLGLVLSKFGMQDADPFMSTQIRVITGIIGFSILFTITGKWYQVKAAMKHTKAMWHITIGSFFGPFLGVSLSLLAIKYTTTGIASTLNSLTPVLIIPLAWYFFKEKITTKEVIGAFLAVAGVTIFFIY